jgi:hypothetical protein
MIQKIANVLHSIKYPQIFVPPAYWEWAVDIEVRE